MLLVWSGAELVMQFLHHLQKLKPQFPKRKGKTTMEIRGSIKVQTQPAAEVITLQQAKDHLRVDISADDTLITSLIVAARNYFEQVCQINIASKQLVLALDGFPATQLITTIISNTNYPYRFNRTYFDGVIYLPGPVISIDSFTYIDSNSVVTTLTNPTDYRLDVISSPARITTPNQQVWPTALNVINSVLITYTAGMATVPQLLKSGMLFYIAHLYENREGVAEKNMSEVPLAVDSICNLYSSGVYH